MAQLHLCPSSGEHSETPLRMGMRSYREVAFIMGAHRYYLAGHRWSMASEPYWRAENSGDARFKTCFHKKMNHCFGLVSVVVALVSMTLNGTLVQGILAITFLMLLALFCIKSYFNKFWPALTNFVFSPCMHILGKLALRERNILGLKFAGISDLFSIFSTLLIKKSPSAPMHVNFTWTICLISKLVCYGFSLIVITNKRDKPVKRLKLKQNWNEYQLNDMPAG